MQEPQDVSQNENTDSGFDPFSCSEQTIAALELDVVFRLGKHSTSLRAHIKKRTRAKRITLAYPGVHYVRAERSYFIPAQSVAEVIRSLRDAKLSFAFSEDAGQRLKQSSSLRKSIISGSHSPSAEELRHCLLVPYVCESKPSEKEPFCLEWATSEQLKQFLPNEKDHKHRKRRARALSERVCIEGLYQSQRAGVKIWLSKSIERFLRKREDAYLRNIRNNKNGFADALLSVVTPPCCWSLTESLGGRLIMAKDLAEEISLSKLTDAIPPVAFVENSRGFLMIDFDNQHLLDAVDSLKNVPRSKLFTNLVQKLIVRRERMAVRDAHLSARDWKLNLQDQALEAKLYPHQRVAVHWLGETPRAMLGDDMGLGKTLTLLTAFRMKQQNAECDFLLVVCPNSLVHNWVSEACSWFSDLTLAVLPSAKKAKEKLLSGSELTKYDGLVVNFEAVRRKEVYSKLASVIASVKPMLCVDESQRAKNPQSQTFAALRELSAKCSHRVLLSGTPTPKDISDIWSQVLLLDDGERFGTNYFDWLETVAELGTKWSRVAIRKFKPDGVNAAAERVHEILLRRKKEEVVDLPEKTFLTRDVELKSDQLKRYEEVRKELLLRVTAISGEEYYREVRSLAEEYLRAVQIASNPRLVDPAWSGEPAKFLELDEIVREVVEENDRKLVIWTNYLGNVSELTERYAKYGAAAFSGEVDTSERERTIRRFQGEESPRILIALPAAGGVGITLTAAQTAVYLDKTWNAEHWMQSIDRLHRIGQTGTVAIISLHACKIDRLISGNLSRKQRAQAQLLGDEAGQIGTIPSRRRLLEAVS